MTAVTIFFLFFFIFSAVTFYVEIILKSEAYFPKETR